MPGTRRRGRLQNAKFPTIRVWGLAGIGVVHARRQAAVGLFDGLRTMARRALLIA